MLLSFSCDSLDGDLPSDSGVNFDFLAVTNLNAGDSFGVPPYKLELKLGCIIMLTYNVNVKRGLDKWSSWCCRCTLSRVAQDEVLNGDERDNHVVFVPRIRFKL